MQHTFPDKPFSPSCDRNKEPILQVLKSLITQNHHCLLEIGSGTGQHAVAMAPHFSQLTWYPSDIPDKHDGMQKWFQEANIPNIVSPLAYELGKDTFPDLTPDIIFTANTFHIMSWQHVKLLIEQTGKHLKPDALFIIYGPFNYNGNYTSESNKNFDQSLKASASHQGIRHFENINECMERNGFSLAQDIPMPANNRTLSYQR